MPAFFLCQNIFVLKGSFACARPPARSAQDDNPESRRLRKRLNPYWLVVVCSGAGNALFAVVVAIGLASAQATLAQLCSRVDAADQNSGGKRRGCGCLAGIFDDWLRDAAAGNGHLAGEAHSVFEIQN